MCWFDISCISPPLWKEIMKALFEVVIVTLWTYQSKLSLSSISCIFPFVPFALFLCVLFSCITWNNQTFTVNVGPKLPMEWETYSVSSSPGRDISNPKNSKIHPHKRYLWVWGADCCAWTSQPQWGSTGDILNKHYWGMLLGSTLNKSCLKDSNTSIFRRHEFSCSSPMMMTVLHK